MSTVDQKWFRQNAGDSSRKWIFFLCPEARIAWQMLQEYVCHAQVSQKRAGVAVALDVEEAAHQWRVSPDSVQIMLDAAVRADKLAIEEGTWAITDRRAFQSEAAERVSAARRTTRNASKDREQSEPPEQPEQPSSGSDCSNNDEQPRTTVTRQVQGQRHSATPDGVAVAEGDSPIGPEAPRWRALEDPLPEAPPPDLDWFGRIAWTLRAIQEKAHWKAVLAPDVKRHLGADKPVRALIELYGEVETVAIFLFAHATWSAEKRPTWSAVLDQREQLRERMRNFHPDRDAVPEKAATTAMSNRDLAREMIAIVAARRANP